MRMVAGSILVLAAAVFVPGLLAADAVYRLHPTGEGLGATALLPLQLLAAAVALTGAALLAHGVLERTAGRGEGERARRRESGKPPRPAP